MEIRHIYGNTYCIETITTCVPFYKLDEKRVVLLDSGLDIEPQRSRLISLLSPFEVAAVITTHAHPDHLGANGHFQQNGAKIYMPRFEAECVASPEHLKAWYSLFSLEEIKRYFGHLLLKTDVFIEPSDRSVTIEGQTFAITPAPGHTMSHICITTPDGVFYAADALMPERDCKYSKLPYAFCVQTYLQTLETLRGLKAEAYVLAHGGPVSALDGLIDMNIESFSRCADRILDLVNGPMSLEDILSAVIFAFHMKKDADVYVFRVYERNTRSFIENLIDTGRLKPQVMGGRLYYTKE